MGVFVTVSELSDLLNGTGISARQAAEKADKMGIHLPYGSIASYWSGRHPQHPSEKTLEGLAEVLNIPLRRLRRAAGAAAGEATPWQPPPEANRLTQRQRRALEVLIKSIVSGEIDKPQPTVSEFLGVDAPRVDRANYS
jgi:transcriptional regulator with XRE-family HTH domain